MNSYALVVEWFASLGISNLLTTEDLLSGNTLHLLMKKNVSGYKNQLITPNSAVNKITNWNNLIKSLQKINIKISNDQKNNIFQGNQHIVYDILAQVKRYFDEVLKQPQVDINKIDYRSDPKNSKSLLQLFILVIIKNLGLNAKESVALLSNDSKYLAHILAKGFKDQPNPVLNMLKDFQSLIPKIRQFCANKENEVFFMKSIKPGLISKFRQVSELSLEILEQFSLLTVNPFEALKLQLIPTLVLQYRRHQFFLNSICKTIIKLSKYTKPLLTLLTNNMNQKQLLAFSYEILCISEQTNQLKSYYSLLKIEDIIVLAIDSLNDSNLFSLSLLILTKMLITNIQLTGSDLKNLNNMLNNLQHLTITKAEHMYNYINGLFTLLEIFAKNKHPLSSQVFKLCVQKYKLALNQEESSLYVYNFLYMMDRFPSILNSLIVDAVIERYESYKEVVSQLDVQILTRVAFGYNRYGSQAESDYQQLNPKIPDEKTALKIYNTLSKMFFQNIHNAIQIADTIVFIIVSQPQSQFLPDLTVKLVKVSLAVHYANLRKLHTSKSIIEGTVKLDSSNALTKRKNLDIQYLLKEILSLQNQTFNSTVEPLVCYSYIQSTAKNKSEAEGLQKLLQILGNPDKLVKKYEQDVKSLHQQKKINKKKPSQSSQHKDQSKINVASSDFLNKKKILSGQNYSMFLSRIQKITPDAKNGLLKAQNRFEDKKKKIQLEQIKKIEEQQKKEQLQKKYTLKVLEKGIRVDPKIDALHQYLYEFNSKQNEIQKDLCYDLSSLYIFNPDEEQQNDIEGLKYLMKKYNRVLKVLYANYGGKFKPNNINSFDELAQKQNLMTVANVWKLFKDYDLDQFLSIRQAQYLVQKINTQKKKPYYDTNLLDFEAFEDFIIQASFTMFSRPPKNLSNHSISQMVEQTFYQFKMLAAQNKIDARLFDDQISALQRDQQISILNNQLRLNSDYILPEGYKKIIDKKVEYFHNIALDAFNSSYTDVLNILEEIVYEKIGVHLLEPFSEITTNVYAKSLLSKKKEQKTEDMKGKYFSLNVKKQLFKYSGEDRIIARQAAFCLGEIVDAVQVGRKSIVKIKYTAKQLQEQKRKAEEQARKKRQKRDQQLKKILEKHKTQKQQIQQSKTQEKLNEQKKLQEEKKKKQKYEQQMKKKIEQYQQKKQQMSKRQQEQKQKQKRKQQQLFDKKRQQLAKAAKQIQEKKEKQKKEAEEKERKQKELLKQKSKKNLKFRSSPVIVKKKVQEPKSIDREKSPQKDNKNQVVNPPKKQKV